MCVYVCVLPACIYVHYLCAQCLWRSEDVLDPLELELLTVVSCPVDAENAGP